MLAKAVLIDSQAEVMIQSGQPYRKEELLSDICLSISEKSARYMMRDKLGVKLSHRNTGTASQPYDTLLVA